MSNPVMAADPSKVPSSASQASTIAVYELDSERFPLSRLGKGWRLLAATLIVLLLPHLAAWLTHYFRPFVAAIDTENAFAWLSIHHLIQFVLTLIVMRLWSPASFKKWGFNRNEARVSLRWFGWFALYCTLGMLCFGILPMVLTHQLPQLGFTLNAQNTAGTLGFYYLISGTGEEPLFRGFVLVMLLRSWTGEWRLGKIVMPVAGLWATLLFMLAHVNFALEPFRITHFSLPQQAFCLGFGLFYAAAFYRTKSLLAPVLAHGFSNGIIWTLIYLAIALTPGQPGDAPATGKATCDPNPPVCGQMMTVTYRAENGPLSKAQHLKFHFGINGWQKIHSPSMTPVEPTVWTLTLPIPMDAYQVDFAFTDGTHWDNNRRRDWHVTTRAAP